MSGLAPVGAVTYPLIEVTAPEFTDVDDLDGVMSFRVVDDAPCRVGGGPVPAAHVPVPRRTGRCAVNVYRDGRVDVRREMCATCIFRPGNLMQGMLAECAATDGTITCHDTLDGDNAICRGFFDHPQPNPPALQIADRLNMIEWVDNNGRGEQR